MDCVRISRVEAFSNEMGQCERVGVGDRASATCMHLTRACKHACMYMPADVRGALWQLQTWSSVHSFVGSDGGNCWGCRSGATFAALQYLVSPKYERVPLVALEASCLSPERMLCVGYNVRWFSVGANVTHLLVSTYPSIASLCNKLFETNTCAAPW